MDEARLRANAREVRTFVAELGNANQAHVDRIMKAMEDQRDAGLDVLGKIENGKPVDWPKPIDYEPTAEERSTIDLAHGRLLQSLTTKFLALTEELAGDIDQDITTWKPPPE